MPLLDWLTRDDDIRRAMQAPYRLLEEAPELSKGDRDAGNMLVLGDNLDALRALLPYYAGRVKLIYIDPPYNTGAAFKHYDDNQEHSIWLSLIYPRLELLREFLSEDGSIWISIDQNEINYLGVICDEIFGRKNKINLVTFKQSSVSGPKTINPGIVTISSYILAYAKSKKRWKPSRVFRARDIDRRYGHYLSNRDAASSEWVFTPVSDKIAASFGKSIRKLKAEYGEDWNYQESMFYINNRSSIVQFVRVLEKDIGETSKIALRNSLTSSEAQAALRDDGSTVYFMNGKQIIFFETKVREIDGELTAAEPISDIWDDILANNVHNEGGVDFDGGKKPESLVQRLLNLNTSAGDLVLDSFLGSGTTAATAHKMGRRYRHRIGRPCCYALRPALA